MVQDTRLDPHLTDRGISFTFTYLVDMTHQRNEQVEHDDRNDDREEEEENVGQPLVLQFRAH